MKTSIATVSISGDLPEKLDAIAEAGFTGVEIFEHDFLVHDASPAEVGKMVRERGLEITLFQPFRDFEGMSEPHRARAFDRAERKFDVMSELGADLLLICSNVSDVALGGLDRAAADLHELGERALPRGIKVGYEALAWGRFVNDHRDAWEIVRRADHANIGIILDSFHTLSRGIPVDNIASIPKEKILLIQLADAPKFDMELLYWSRHFRNMPGEGDLDVAGFMEAVVATGYDGTLSLEVFNDRFRGGSSKAIARDGQRSLISLMDTVRRKVPDAAFPFNKLPDRSAALGIEFVEFAAAADKVGELRDTLGQLGFAHVANHRSKSVELWRQGQINMVINTEARGEAGAVQQVHGVAPHAIGLKLDNAGAATLRADALGMTRVDEAKPADNLDIPAVQENGLLLYFLDDGPELGQVWETEFAFLEDVNAGGIGLTRIDHLAQTYDSYSMQTGLLFYLSLLDLQKSPTVDIPDPRGLIQSLAIHDANRRLRLTLNGADSARTVAGRFVEARQAPGLQHVAFETGDIFATADALEANGFAPLPISPNYFDDVEARFGINPDLSEKLRQHNILYDQDTGGSFYQIFSRSYGAGFFFEIVMRDGAYDGYGGPNAPFRIAAQRRLLDSTL